MGLFKKNCSSLLYTAVECQLAEIIIEKVPRMNVWSGLILWEERLRFSRILCSQGRGFETRATSFCFTKQLIEYFPRIDKNAQTKR